MALFQIVLYELRQPRQRDWAYFELNIPVVGGRGEVVLGVHGHVRGNGLAGIGGYADPGPPDCLFRTGDAAVVPAILWI